MKKDNLLTVIDKFKDKKIAVIGDLILDHFIFGDVERISPEAPIPVVLFEKEIYKLGGAANTANNIQSLGAKAFLIGSIGSDNEGKIFLNEAKHSGINKEGVFVLSSKRPTTLKKRIVARGQQIVRVDREITNDIDKETEENVIRFISDNFKNWDGVIVSDYGKGFITEKIAKTIVALAQKYKKPLLGDIKPVIHTSYFKNIGILTPNIHEAFAISQCDSVNEAGRTIQKKLNCDVLITQGSDGMTLFEDKQIKHFPAVVKEVVDIVGAGDTVAAVFCLSLVSGALMRNAAMVANFAAGIVVNKMGTATVNFDELKKVLENGK